jgi:hypothetical protein
MISICAVCFNHTSTDIGKLCLSTPSRTATRVANELYSQALLKTVFHIVSYALSGGVLSNIGQFLKQLFAGRHTGIATPADRI